MRIFEITLLILSSIFPLLISIKKHNHSKTLPVGIMAITIILHLIFEGYRWQMIPAYAMALLLGRYLFKQKTIFQRGRIRIFGRGLAFSILVLLSWGLPYSLPIFTLPTPTGEYKVGARHIHLKTQNDEIITPTNGDKRELMIKVWYPAQILNETTESYLNEGDRIGFAEKYGLPKSTFNYLDKVITHTYKNPKAANGQFPVLVFSHGIYSKASGYYALLEEIVSQGYIVLNINHTYESAGSLFPNGEIKLFDSEYDKKHNNQEMAEMVWKAMKSFEKASTLEKKYSAIHDLARNYIAADITMRWSKDISLVIDELKNWNSVGFLTNHIDISKIGVLGHSQGGAAAGQALLDDNRIKAGINIDGVQWGPMIDKIMTKPFVLISSDWDSSHPDFNAHIFANKSSPDFYSAKILNSGHSNFMDIPLMLKFQSVNESGSIPPKKAYAITSKTILRFFDSYLLGQQSEILDLKEKYPELELAQG